ncbi:heavy metal translocating P-type ATPase [Desulfosarcina ovata]|uniref:Copper-transporting ATPase n=1 Tax=Desulfosarcina ovata subsp. ovata TaxID=2752305 RepID=A0A5K8AHX0_9BACT|nr:cation-translocating P-type ATPase [Desulfosarcina ovata]BBO91424.1 copper-transporting ATPase [Desulfosarcina ovata subsp. ovata]
MPSHCDLCGLPLRYGTITHTIDGHTLSFCCQGCRMVYTMLLESAEVDDPARFRESDLFRQCVAAGVIPASEADLRRMQETTPTKHASPSQAETAGHASDPPDTLSVDLKVDGMWCPACAWVIETALSRMEGVEQATCHFSTDRLRCHYRPDRTDPEAIRQTVARLGYPVHDTEAGSDGQSAFRRELIRLIITGLFSANVMMLSWALYAGFFTDLTDDAVFKISLPIVLMATVAFVYGGGPMLRKAWFGVVHLAPGMETLVGMAAGCAYVYSLFNWLTGSIHLYFDTASMLITLVLLGKLLELQARGRVRRDLDNFFALQPNKVRIVTDGWPAGRYASIGQLAAGDRFAVEADEIVPADGRVVSGSARVDESALTGEPRPVAVKAGDIIKSGTRVIDGRVIAMAETIGEASVLGQMIAIMTRSLEQKSDFEGRTDRMLRGFVPLIVLLATGTGIACAMIGYSLHQSLVRAVTVMVISCPCALGVAIPMARLAGISLAGRRGILVRDIEAFERAGTTSSIVFDKTGTLTRGRWQLSQVECRPSLDPDQVIAWAAGLEQSVEHEIARAINAHAREKGISPARVDDIVVSSDGIAGRLEKKNLRIGSRQFAWGTAEMATGKPVGQTETALSQVFISVDGQPAASLYFGDSLRPTVPDLIDSLKAEYRPIAVISGDGERVTREVAEALGADVAQGRLLPADKAAFIDKLIQQGHRPAMVGDGINDAAAMARAQLAVALYNGQALAAEAAHLTLMRGDPAQLMDVFLLSRRVNRKVTQNLWCAWIYNLIGIPVAMSGLLTPLIAATAMLLSSLTVIGNTLLLVRRD